MFESLSGWLVLFIIIGGIIWFLVRRAASSGNAVERLPPLESPLEGSNRSHLNRLDHDLESWAQPPPRPRFRILEPTNPATDLSTRQRSVQRGAGRFKTKRESAPGKCPKCHTRGMIEASGARWTCRQCNYQWSVQ